MKMKKKKGGGGGTSEFLTPEEKAHRLNMLVYKQERKEERREAVVNFIKTIVFTPLSMFLRIVAWTTRLVGAVSVFGFFFGIYNGWKFYNNYSNYIAVGDFDLLKYCISFCVLPFIVFAVNHGAEMLADYLESEI